MAVIIAAFQIGVTLSSTSHHRQGCWWTSSCHPAHPGAAAIILLALGPAALLVRRLYPREVLLGVFAIDVLYVALGYPVGANFISLFAAFIAVMMAGHRVEAALALAGTWVAGLWLPWAVGSAGRPNVLATLTVAAWLVVLFGIAEAVRGRRRRATEARRLREQEARRRANEERLQIARELHDVLAHSISLINVQSGVALHLIDERPEQARTALAAINEASADALREVRSVLGVLRGQGEQPPRGPTAGLARLDELVARADAAGVDVMLEVLGERRPLPPSVDLAAFRIVQEAVTNVVRHAGARATSVRLTYGADELTVQVEDDGEGAAPPGPDGTGNGIAGMRERALALGGQFDAGPRPGGGFRVRARLPLRGR
jgi:signal transduction histidine kinase